MKKVICFKNIILFPFKLQIYRFKSLGRNVRLQPDVHFSCEQNISISDNVYIGREAYFDAISEIKIDEGTMIGPRFTCVSGSHNYDSNDLSSIPYDNKIIDLPIVIHKNVWIGANVSVCPGTEIGEGAVIGMGTVVSGYIEPYSVVVSGKPKVIKNRNRVQYEELKKNDKIFNKIYAGKGFKLIKRDT